jgi:hypothetical protein
MASKWLRASWRLSLKWIFAGRLPIQESVLPTVRHSQQDDYFVLRPTLRKRQSSQQLLRGPSPSPAMPYTGWNMPTAKTSGFAQYLPLSLSMKSSNQSQFSQFSQFLSRDRQGSEVSIFPTEMDAEDRVASVAATANIRRSTTPPNRSASPRDRHNFRAQIFSKTLDSASPDTSLVPARGVSAAESQAGGVAMTKQGSRVTFGSPAVPDNRFGRHGSFTALPRHGRYERKVTWQVRPIRELLPVE